MNTSHWFDRKEVYDALIVGGGLSGLSTAYWLNKYDPTLKVALIEKTFIGDGASGRNAGFITSGSATHFSHLIKKYGPRHGKSIWEFAKNNFNLLKSEININKLPSYQENGSFTLAQEKDLKLLSDTEEILKRNHIDFEIFNTADLANVINSTKFDRAIKIFDEASINPMEILNTLKNELPFLDIYEGCELKNYSKNEKDLSLETSRGRFQAKKVLFCLNAFTNTIVKDSNKYSYPVRAQMLSLESSNILLRGNFYYTPQKIYFRKHQNNILIGGLREIDLKREFTNKNEINDKIQDSLEEFIKEIFPSLKSIQINKRWSGIMGFTEDGLPFCKNIEKGVYVMGGYNCHGLGHSFLLSKNFVEIIFENRKETLFNLVQSIS